MEFFKLNGRAEKSWKRVEATSAEGNGTGSGNAPSAPLVLVAAFTLVGWIGDPKKSAPNASAKGARTIGPAAVGGLSPLSEPSKGARCNAPQHPQPPHAGPVGVGAAVSVGARMAATSVRKALMRPTISSAPSAAMASGDGPRYKSGPGSGGLCARAPFVPQRSVSLARKKLQGLLGGERTLVLPLQIFVRFTVQGSRQPGIGDMPVSMQAGESRVESWDFAGMSDKRILELLNGLFEPTLINH